MPEVPDHCPAITAMVIRTEENPYRCDYKGMKSG